jgi:hypothetical protein
MRKGASSKFCGMLLASPVHPPPAPNPYFSILSLAQADRVYLLAGALSRVLADRSKLQGMQRGLVHALRALHHAAKSAISSAN